MGRIYIKLCHKLFPSWISKLRKLKKSSRKTCGGRNTKRLVDATSLKETRQQQSINSIPTKENEGNRSIKEEEEENCVFEVVGSDNNENDTKFEKHGDIIMEKKSMKLDIGNEEARGRRKSKERRRRSRSSLSASLPLEVKSESVGESVALVIYSYNPYKDFRESMVQMINTHMSSFHDVNIEEILYCYFALNPPEHHASIRQAFLDLCNEMQPACIYALQSTL